MKSYLIIFVALLAGLIVETVLWNNFSPTFFNEIGESIIGIAVFFTLLMYLPRCFK
jgi:hypothetical protein